MGPSSSPFIVHNSIKLLRWLWSLRNGNKLINSYLDDIFHSGNVLDSETFDNFGSRYGLKFKPSKSVKSDCLTILGIQLDCRNKLARPDPQKAEELEVLISEVLAAGHSSPYTFSRIVGKLEHISRISV